MRICLLTLDYPPFRSSGLTIYAETIARGLVGRGHNVTVVASQRPDQKRMDGVREPDEVTVFRVPVGPLDWLGFGWQAARYLRSQATQFEAVHFADVHFAYAYYGPFVASAFQSFRQRLTSNRGRPYHVNWRDYLFRLVYYNGARWAMEQPAVRRACHVIMPSLATQTEFVDHYDLDPAKTSLIYPGINVRRFDAQMPEKTTARQRLGLPADGPVILYVGFSTPRKGVEYLARALEIMDTPAQLLMVGKWEAGYQGRFLAALGPTGARVHVAGYVPDADLLYYYAACDVFVLPTLLEGFGIPLVEAMAAGRPVVTTTAGSAGEIVGNAGLVVPPGDSDALASALDTVLADAALRRRLERTGRIRAREMFDESRFVREVETAYQLVFGT